MLFTAVDHPAIACRESRALANWYLRHLEMRVIAEDGREPPAYVLGYEAGGAVIEIMPARDDGPAPAAQLRFQPGLRHLAFRVNDFAAAKAKLEAAGVVFITEPGEALGGGRIASFRDPEGNELQIVQRS